MSTTTDSMPDSSEPIEHFALPRTVVRGVRACATAADSLPEADIFYLWLQLGSGDSLAAVSVDAWLNVLDEAASVGVNWLVIALGEGAISADPVDALCRWAQETHDMTVCLHTSASTPDPALEGLVTTLAREKTYLLVESAHASAYTPLKEQGVCIGMASPASHIGDSACEYPYKMVFVNAEGNLYTCGLVAGEQEFFLGSVFSGSLERIVHNPKLPHSVDALETRPKQGCSGCPPLVAKYLCQR